MGTFDLFVLFFFLQRFVYKYFRIISYKKKDRGNLQKVKVVLIELGWLSADDTQEI